MSDTTDELQYATAVAELDDILNELEDEALDVDILATRVERASTLIRFCRGRITSARTQVEQIVADLDALSSSDTVASDDPAESTEDE
jgi:exodeoxyribonuclease VII small subunit